MKLFKCWSILGVTSLSVALSACGGGTSSSLIGFTVTGLASGTSVTLVNNGVNPITISTNGTAAFSVPLQSGSTYSVAVSTQPVGQICQVTNGTGTVNNSGAPVTNVAVNCSSSVPTNNIIFGAASGIPAGTSVTLMNNNVDTVNVTTNGTFAFPNQIPVGATYSVVVVASSNTTGRQCTLNNASGVVPASGTITPIQLTCQ